jgi:uncharacterized membrane protein
MRCDHCGNEASGALDVCPRCRAPLEDSSRTAAWTAAKAGQEQFDAELRALRGTQHRRVLVGVLVGLVVLLVGALAVAVVILASRRSEPASTPPGVSARSPQTDGSAKGAAATAPAPAVSANSPQEVWWTPPSNSPRQQVEVLAYDFSGVDEHDLGAVFTEDLQPVAGAPHLFEESPPKRVKRNQVDKHLLRSWDGSSLDSKIRFLFLGLGLSNEQRRDRAVFHSREIEQIVTVDESARMRRPPASAMFYLSAVHIGSCVDFVIEGDYAETGKKLSLLFGPGSVSLQDVNSRGRYDLSVRGLGVRDVNREGIWAMTIDDITRSYRAESAMIELVFTTIPGRIYHAPMVAVPFAAIDEPEMQLKDGGYSTWTISSAGRYRLVGRSSPNGLGIAWSEGVECDTAFVPGAEYRSLDMTCMVPASSALRISNPTTFGLGDDETMSIYLAKLP